MSKIDNLTNRLVILRLNSGRTLYIDSKSISGEIQEAELRNNRKFNKLRERRVIAVHPYKEEKLRPSKRPGKVSPAAAAGLGKEKPGKITNKEDKKQTKTKGGK